MKRILTYLVTAFLCLGLCSIQTLAAQTINDDLNVTGSINAGGHIQINGESEGANILFNDIDDTEGLDYEWEIYTYTFSEDHTWELKSEHVDGPIIGIYLDENSSAANALDSLTVDSNGVMDFAGGAVTIDREKNRVGIGTAIPEATLDVQWSGSNEVDDGLQTLVLLAADNSAAGKASDAGFALVNKKQDFQWNFRTLEYNNAFTATKSGSGGGEFLIQSPTNDFHDAKMKVGGVTVFENGHLVTASSRTLKTDIKPLDTQMALDAFEKLQPVSYAYKAHKDEPVVGFIAEDVPELLAMPSGKTFDSTEMVAVLTSVLADTRAELKIAQEKIIRFETMQKRLAKVESLLTNLALDTSSGKKEELSFNLK